MQCIKLGQFEVDQATQLLSFHGSEISLTQKKFFEVLLCLIDKYPEFVTREELIESVWQGNYYVGEKAVNNAIWVLRKTLKEHDPEQQYIITKRGLGYRLTLQPEIIEKKTFKPWQIVSLAAITVTVVTVLSILFVNQQSRLVESTITDSIGNESEPKVAPSGKELAYIWKKPGQSHNLFIRKLGDSQNVRQITFTNTHISSPAWIDNGLALAYVEKDEDAQTCRVNKVVLATLQVTPITQCNFKVNTYIASNKNGSSLLVNKTRDGIFNTGVYLIDLTSRPFQERRISCDDSCDYEDREAVFAPDSSYIVVSRRSDRLSENLYRIDLDTNQEQQLTFNETDIKGLSVSKQGAVYFAAKKAGQNVAKQVAINGGEVSELGVIGFRAPSVNMLNDEVYFSKMRGAKGISFINLAEQQYYSQPLMNDDYAQRNPAYSTIAQKLAYVSSQSGALELWISNSDGSDKEQLTYLNSVVLTPSWSHDGQSIAFLTPKQNGQGNEISIIHTKTRQITQVTSPFNTHNRPIWRLDNRAILAAVATDEGSILHRFSLNNDEPVVPVSQRQIRFAQPIGVSPQLDVSQQRSAPTWLFSKYDNGGLWRATEDEKGTFTDIEKLLSGDELSERYNWWHHNNTVFYVKAVGQHFEFKRYNLTDKRSTLIASVPQTQVDSLGSVTYVPELKWLLYTKRKDNPADIAKLRFE